MKKAFVAFLGFAVAIGGGYSLLVASHPAIQASLGGSPEQTAEMAVYPREAGGLPATDIGELVASLTPPHGFDHLGWDFLVDSPFVHWMSDGVTITETSAALREGLVRVRIGGRLSTRIRKHREELAWTVTLGNWDGAKWGPQWITLEPGAPAPGQCFGALDDGCTFAVSEALSAPTLSSNRVCNVPELGGGNREVYSIRVRGGQPSILIYKNGVGSGGVTTTLEIRPASDTLAACKPDH